MCPRIKDADYPYWADRGEGNEKVPRMTQVIKFRQETGALMYWAHQQGLAGKDLYEERDKAGDAGTIAHQLVEHHIRGTEPPDYPDNEITEQGRQGFINYLNWESRNNVVIVESEVKLISRKLWTGGTMDAVGYFDVHGSQRLEVFDWKTSKSRIYYEYLIQMAGYRGIWNELNPDRPIRGYNLLHFSKENADFTHYHYEELDEAWECFLHMRAQYDLIKELKKRVK